MDGGQISLQDRLERAAAHLEAIGDPSAPFVRALALRSAIEDRHDAKMDEAILLAKRLGERPMISDHQFRAVLFPAIMGAVKHWHLAVMAVLVVAGFVVGVAAQRYVWAPRLTCESYRGGVSCGYWKEQPTQPETTAAPATDHPTQTPGRQQ